MWVDGLLPEALVHSAVASSLSGARVLFISPLVDQLAQLELKLSRRGPLLALQAGAKSAVARGPITALASPDELALPLISRVFGEGGPDFVFVDEAQAASSLACTYRPSFAKVAAVLKRYPKSGLVCGASTSARGVRQDVARVFACPNLSLPPVLTETAVIESPRLRLEVKRASTPHDASVSADQTPESQPEFMQMVAGLPRPTLVLCGTVAQADAVYSNFVAEQLPAHRYHSGLSDSERAQQLLQFALPGRRAIMVAVSGFSPGSGFFGAGTGDVPENFGPGYVRRDIRSLVHLSAPASLEQYAMELRLLEAGPKANSQSFEAADPSDAADDSFVEETSEKRDDHHEALDDSRGAGLDLVALLVYHPAHLQLTQSLLDRKRPTREAMMRLAERLAQAGAEWIEERDLAENGLQSRKLIQACTGFLIDAGVVARQGTRLRTLGSVQQLQEVASQLASDLERLRDHDTGRLEQVAAYGEGETCRRVLLDLLLGRLEHDDSQSSEACGRCDVCAGPTHNKIENAKAVPFASEPAVGSRHTVLRTNQAAGLVSHIDSTEQSTNGSRPRVPRPLRVRVSR